MRILVLGVVMLAGLGGQAAAAAPEGGEHGTPGAGDPLVIAHRGAPRYLPEHTLVSYAMAYAQGADYLEPDLVLTGDGHPIALHDRTLDATTDVAGVYPGRAREDGRHYAVDFTLEEIRALSVHERVDPDSGRARYPQRFPPDLLAGALRVPTLVEVIELLAGLNRATGREVGLYPEIKFAAFHESEGLDITAEVIAVLDAHGYRDAHDRCFIQSFEPATLRRLRDAFATRLRLIQLLGENAWEMNEVDYDPLYTPSGLAGIARYADGIGAPLSRVIETGSAAPGATPLVADAHRAGLAVHAYTVRSDALPPGLDLDTLLRMLIEEAGVDGLFVDPPDRMVDWLSRGPP